MRVVIVSGKKLEFLGCHHGYLHDEIRISVGPRTRVASVARMLERLSTREALFGGFEFPDGFLNAKTLSGKPPIGAKVRR